MPSAFYITADTPEQARQALLVYLEDLAKRAESRHDFLTAARARKTSTTPLADIRDAKVEAQTLRSVLGFVREVNIVPSKKPG